MGIFSDSDFYIYWAGLISVGKTLYK